MYVTTLNGKKDGVSGYICNLCRGNAPMSDNATMVGAEYLTPMSQKQACIYSLIRMDG
jgi:hypothetical protein